MKILFLNHSMHCGGAERVTANLANGWVSYGSDVTIATFTSSDRDFYELDARVRRVALDIAASSQSRLAALRHNIGRIAAIRKVIRAEKPDLVIGVMTIPSIMAILASIGLRQRVVATEHNHPPMLPVGALWHGLRRWTFRHAAAVVALTRESAVWLETHCGCRNVSVVPNPVPVPVAATTPTLLPRNVVSSEHRVLLAAGRLVPQKGFDLLIQAFATIQHRVPHWRLVILGEGPQRESLEALVKVEQLEDSVVMPGRAGNIADWYERADLYVLSSRFEGFSLTLAEAIASGCPAVSYDCDVGPRDIIRDGIEGVLVPQVGSVDHLADALHALMTDDTTRQRMAERARNAAERFSPTEVFSMWDRVFEEAGVGRVNLRRS